MNSIYPSLDPQAFLTSCRESMASMLQVQQENLKVLERLARYQYAIAGDYMEWFLTQAKTAVAAASPTEFLAKQTELGSALSEALRNRGQELSTIASETQSTITQLVGAAAAKASTSFKEAA